MKLTIKLAMVCLAILGLLALGACSGGAAATNSGGCQSDKDCNAADKCMVCSGGSCQKVADCCLTDVECGGGQRCWNEKGKAYGKCGSAN